MANGINLTRLRAEIRRHVKIYSQSDVIREYGDHPAHGSAGAYGLWLDVSVDREYAAVPLDTWRKLLQHYSIWRRPYITDSRDCDEYAKALFGLPGWQHEINGVAYIRDNSSLHAYNLLLVRSLEWDARRDRLLREKADDPQAFFDRYNGAGEDPADPVEPKMEQRVFWQIYDPMLNRFFYNPDPTSKFDPHKGYISCYGYDPHKPEAFKPRLDHLHLMESGTITFG